MDTASRAMAEQPPGKDEQKELCVCLSKLGVEASSAQHVAVLRSLLREHLLKRPWPFEVTRLSERTLVLVEMDRFGERPHIYIVCGRKKAVIIDTGCGTVDLREFLWTLPELDGLQLQVVNTHVHYDHIMGNHSFCTAGGTAMRARCLGICQGARDRAFSENWKETSLQKSVGASIDSFSVTQWLEEGHKIYLDDDAVSDEECLHIIYTPGHTPDSISLYLPIENRIFTGDLIYPGSIYLFLQGSCLREFEESIDKLRRLVAEQPPGVVLSCGHITPSLPATKLEELYELLPAIRSGRAEMQIATISWYPKPAKVFRTSTFTLMCRAEDVVAV